MIYDQTMTVIVHCSLLEGVVFGEPFFSPCVTFGGGSSYCFTQFGGAFFFF
jgi:hypothetical protein